MSDHSAEVLKSDVSEGREWEFVAKVRVRLHNPDGDDVVVLCTYQARPKFDDLTDQENAVHETRKYWWPDSYPKEGDSAFFDSMATWDPGADLDDDEALLEECVEHNATHDPTAVFDMLLNLNNSDRRGNRRVRERLTGETEAAR